MAQSLGGLEGELEAGRSNSSMEVTPPLCEHSWTRGLEELRTSA